MVEYPLIIILAFTMSSKESDFNDFVRRHDEAFMEWRDRNPGDHKAYLDSKVLEFSKPKDIKTLKKQVYLLAMYKVKKELPSKILQETFVKYEDWLQGLDIGTITWQFLLDKVQSFNNAKEDEGRKKDFSSGVKQEKSSGG